VFKEKKKRIDLNTFTSNPNPLEIQVGDSTRIVSSWPNNDISLTYRFSWNLRGYPFFNWDFPSEQLPFWVPGRVFGRLRSAPRISPSTRHQWDVSLSRLPPLSDFQGPVSAVKLHATPRGQLSSLKILAHPVRGWARGVQSPPKRIVFRFHATLLRRWLDPFKLDCLISSWLIGGLGPGFLWIPRIPVPAPRFESQTNQRIVTRNLPWKWKMGTSNICILSLVSA